MKVKAGGDEQRGVIIRLITEIPERVFVVGDIHGHAEEVSRLVDYLVSQENLSSRDQLIFIGDYIDRGRDSKGVLDKMLEVRRNLPRTVFLKGNHEDMLLDFLGLGGSNGDSYLQNGGATFFKSYGINTIESLTAILRSIPESHINFLQNLELGVSLAEFVFVHAGLAPNRPLDRQLPEDVLWIRDKFLNSTHEFNKIVVFGHTAFSRVLVDLPYKIGIDTGIAYGNKLSAVELVSGELYQIGWGDSAVRRGSLV
jgi:serine/threonine protein phosphatase 1